MDTVIYFSFSFSVYQLVGMALLAGLVITPVVGLLWRNRKAIARYINNRV